MLIFEKRNTYEHVDIIDSFVDRMRGHFHHTLVLVIQVSSPSAHSELNSYSLLCWFAMINCFELNIELCYIDQNSSSWRLAANVYGNIEVCLRRM